MAQMTAEALDETRAVRRTGHRSRNDVAANGVLIGVALALFALRLVMAGETGLVDDEAYYRIWSLAPALSYLDHPPMVAWMIGAGRLLAGDTAFGVRLLGPFGHLMGAGFLWRTALLLYGAEVARRAVWVLLAMPLLAVGGIVVTPDLPSVLFAGMVLWALAELDRSRNANWWLAVGLLAGLGLLSKYTNLSLGATIVVWLLGVRRNWPWLKAPQLWLGGVVAALVTSPVVIWNAEHDWASFAKQFGRVTHAGSAGLGYLFEFFGSYMALASPIVAVLSIGGLVVVTRAALSARRSPDVMLAAAVLPLTVYFLVHSLHDRVQGNWLAPLYPALAICAAIGLDRLVRVRWRRGVFGAAIGFGFLITGVIYAHALHPIRAAASLKDPTEQMRGWPALADAIEEKRREAGAAWVATSSYATTGQIAFGLRGRAEVAQLNDRIRYIFLPPLPPKLLEQPALYVELDYRVDLPLLQSKFGTITPLGSLKRLNGSAAGATYLLFLVSDPPEPPI